MKANKFLSLAILGLSTSALASGFGLYEASTKTYAMGGAVLGKAADASANFHNPATLTDLTNITITVGAMTEHPRARIKVKQNGETQSSQKMNSGLYVLPHLQMAVPLPFDLVFGLGMMPEYGLGSVYDNNWTLNYAGIDTQVTSFTLNPNLAWKVTDKLSIGAGMRFIYWDFEQYSRPMTGVKTRLKGDNGFTDYGYQVGLKYDVLDNFSVGIVYKSDIGCHVKGKREMNVAGKHSMTDVKAVIHMPQSITGGFNWDITDDWHLGGMLAWTQWSSVDKVPFMFGHGSTASSSLCTFDWNDTWRVGISPSWDFAENWTWIGSYVFENDCSSSQYSVMLPPSHRHMLTTGFCWAPYDWMELALSYGVILMDGQDSHVSKSRPTDKYCAHHGISHTVGFSITFRF